MNTIEVEEINKLIKKYDVILKDDIEEKDLILKYETLYDQIKEFVINKRNDIKYIEKTINAVSGFEDNLKFETIFKKKKNNANQIIDCNNRMVERIRELETTIYNKRMKELDNMKVERYNIDREMEIIKNSMNVLKDWSNKSTFNVIFDSDINGDGSKNVLHNIVFNKSNLYFIHFDVNNNVFGTYVNTEIYRSANDINILDNSVGNKNSFVFSLIRNGKKNNKRYFVKQDKKNPFYLWNNDPNGALYRCAEDMSVWKVGSDRTWCTANSCHCDYENDKKPLTDMTYPDRFLLQRIVVLQMN